MTGVKEKIELTPAEDSTWGKFMRETIRLDTYHEKPEGWHWFCAFKDLSGSDLKEIQKMLPEQHPFKHETAGDFTVLIILRDVIAWLRQELGNTGIIKEIDFSERAFKNVDFSFFVFPIKVSFAKAVFYESANFSNVLFFGNADLSNPNNLYISKSRTESADFTETYFTKQAIFTNTIFSESVSFNDSVFNGGANFKDAVFDTLALFLNITFKFYTDFTNAIFHGITGFAKTKFLSGVNFTNATFIHGVTFDKIKTASSTNFTKTKFKNSTPNFYNADLHSDIIWDESKWPILNRKSNTSTVDKNKSAYENLASHMKKLDKYHDEHFFYRQEMRCRRWLTRYPAKCFYWLYEKFSDYGYGIKQAFLWWLAHLAVGMFAIAILSLINSWLECWKDGAWETTKSALCSIPLSFANAHGFLPFYKGALSGCYKYFMYDNYFNTIWALQTVLGILFLFLLVLTVRIRFRLK